MNYGQRQTISQSKNYNKANALRRQKESTGRGRKHPVYRFLDKNDRYICEVRYGGASANALPFFTSVTNGWIDYSHNLILVKLFSHALVSSKGGHEAALSKIKQDILKLKRENNINA